MNNVNDSAAITRRTFIPSAAATSAAALPIEALHDLPAKADQSSAASSRDSRVIVSMRINDQVHALAVDPRTTLLDAIRDTAGLETGWSVSGAPHRSIRRTLVLPQPVFA